MHHNFGNSSSCMASKWLLASSAALPTNNGLIGTRGHHFAPRTTDTRLGNCLHCKAENQIPIPNFQVWQKHILLATSAQNFRFMPSLGVRCPCFAPFAGIDTLISPSHFYACGQLGNTMGPKPQKIGISFLYQIPGQKTLSDYKRFSVHD